MTPGTPAHKKPPTGAVCVFKLIGAEDGTERVSADDPPPSPHLEIAALGHYILKGGENPCRLPGNQID